MVTGNSFVIGFDAKYFSFLLDVYTSARGVLFPLAVTRACEFRKRGREADGL
jgi:hypothetical protein